MTGSDTATCPICDTEIEAANRADPVTYVLDPCGHEVDEHVYEDLVDE